MLKDWSQVDVERFVELCSLKKEDFKVDDDYYIQLLSLIHNVDESEIEILDYDEFQDRISKLSFITAFPTNQPRPFVKTQAGVLHLINDLNIISIGEFIDLENLFVQDQLLNLPLILSILYRQIEVKKSLLFPDAYEPYGNWIHHRSSLFNHLPITDVYGVLTKYAAFRTHIFSTYEGLFDESTDEKDLEPFDENESVISKAERLKEAARNSSLKKWGWDVFLLRLAKQNFCTIEKATTIPLLEALNTLSMKKELNITD